MYKNSYRFKVVSAFAVLALLVGFMPTSHAQSARPARRFVKAPVTGKFVPAVPIGGQRLMTVVLKMADDPVAVVRSRAAGKQLPDADKKAIEQNLRTKQEALIPEIQAHGATVLGKFQNAINGIKVRGTADQIASLAHLPGVVAVKPVMVHQHENAESVPFLGTPAVWQGPPGLRGEHIRVASIDTGIDYTHANFGGPGTVAAFNAAFANDTAPADPAFFGPNAPKVKGGTDLVGDAYNANDPTSVPMPDPNPLDCNGHGSHTAGTLAGFGVNADGTTYTGPYDTTTPSVHFRIGPGVAPLADLYAVRVFGCTGSTNVVVEAIDWAIQNNMQVISMSLGAPFGTEDSADAEAAENAAEAGIVVVASAGNAGPGTHITGSPASGDKTISVAAMDSHTSFPGATLALSTGNSILAQDSNGATFGDGTSLGLVVLRNPSGTISLGCNDGEYVDSQIAGKLVVTLRGRCPRVQRAQSGQAHGAAAVAMINTAAGYPPFEGDIPGVTIPFLGVTGGDGAALAAATSATLNNTTIANPTSRSFASFTSGGPRNGDGHLKPDLAAPGVSVFSTAIGTGNQGFFASGTSMSAPHVAGVAALAIQAHPEWDADEVTNAIVNTADASQLVGYGPRLGGNGLVQPFPATRTSVIARTKNDAPSLSFGVAQFTSEFEREGEIRVRNLGSEPESFSVEVEKGAGSSPHSVSVHPKSLWVPAGRSAELHVRLEVPGATTGDSGSFREVAGLVKLKPTDSSGNGGAALSVPYYLVPRARSEVKARIGEEFSPDDPATTVTVHNESHAVAGTADFYAWGLKGGNKDLGSIGLRAVGVQSFDAGPPLGELLVFAVNTFKPWSNAATNEFDILLDVNGDGVPDFDVVGFDLGALTTGSFSGQVASFVIDLKTGVATPEFLATAPTDGSSIELAIVASDVGITAANPRFTYTAASFDLLGTATDATAGTASFNAFNNAISTGAFAILNPGDTAKVGLTIDPAEWAITPALGVMVVSLDNFAGGRQALLLRVPGGGDDE